MRTVGTILGLGLLAVAIGCQSQSAGREIKDTSITAAVKTRLASDVRLATLTKLDVTTESGKVSLNGTVESEEVKRQCEESARQVAGVTRVINNLQVVPKADTAQAHFVDAKGNPVGTALITQTSAGGVQFHFSLNGLPPGLHGLHVHEKGDCTKPSFKSAGKHFNPAGKEHGAENPKGFHAGDLGNLEVGSDGKANTEVTAPQLTLEAGENSLIRPGGTALIIHAVRDDQKSDPSGNSGDPIACGVIDAAAFTHSAIHTSR